MIYDLGESLLDVLTLNLDSFLSDMLSVAYRMTQSERGPGTKEDTDLSYSVVHAELIDAKTPYFYPLISRYLASLCIPGVPRLRLVHDSRMRYHVNILDAGRGYERHTDDNPWTIVMFLNDSFEGGRLHVESREASVSVRPVRGTCILFSGRRYEHFVDAPSKGFRASLVLSLAPVYDDPLKDDYQELSDYLFGRREA